MHPLDPSTAAPFVAETLKILREEVGPETAVLGFVGCPYTLATYMIEGKTSKDYINIKKMAFNEPKLLHAILKNLAESIGDYALFQIENGAQLIQIFDSWAGHLSPRDYEEFASPYQKMILDKVRFSFLFVTGCRRSACIFIVVVFAVINVSCIFFLLLYSRGCYMIYGSL